MLQPLISFLICLFLTPVVRGVAKMWGWVAYPREDRWHKRVTPVMGGIAIYCAVGLPLLWLVDFRPFINCFKTSSFPSMPLPFHSVLWLGMTLLFLLGVLDDFIHIKPHNKLVAQIMVASMVAFLGCRLGWSPSLTVDMILTIVWIVGITNAFNLLDNMDGLCAGVGAIAAIFFALIFYENELYVTLYVPLMLAGALIAFLIYNFNPASIFMGDSGSLVIGFTLSMFSLNLPDSMLKNTLSLIAVPVLILLVPIFDTSLVTLVRILSRRKASVGGHDHTSHRLVLMGFTERGAVLLLYGTSVLSGLSALFVKSCDSLTSPVVIIPMLLTILFMGVYLAQIRVYPEKEFCLLRDGRFTPILFELTYKRQVFLVILDLALISFSYYLSYRLRFSDPDFSYFFKLFLRSLPIIIACKFISFFAVGVYRGIWRYMSLNDIYTYLKATLLGSLLSVAAVTYFYRFQSFSKGVFIIDWFLLTMLLIGSRGSFRSFIDLMKRKRLSGERVLIYGAGRGGEVLLREILNNQRLGIKPIGFIDDDRMKSGKRLLGYPILGTIHDLEGILERFDIDGVVISFNRKNEEKMKRLINLCQQRKLFLKRFSIRLDDVITS
nr:glycosyl transferase [Desulfobacterales bacterium]